jgi:hypothetical protein
MFDPSEFKCRALDRAASLFIGSLDKYMSNNNISFKIKSNHMFPNEMRFLLLILHQKM